MNIDFEKFYKEELQDQPELKYINDLFKKYGVAGKVVGYNFNPETQNYKSGWYICCTTEPGKMDEALEDLYENSLLVQNNRKEFYPNKFAIRIDDKPLNAVFTAINDFCQRSAIVKVHFKLNNLPIPEHLPLEDIGYISELSEIMSNEQKYNEAIRKDFTKVYNKFFDKYKRDNFINMFKNKKKEDTVEDKRDVITIADDGDDLKLSKVYEEDFDVFMKNLKYFPGVKVWASENYITVGKNMNEIVPEKDRDYVYNPFADIKERRYKEIIYKETDQNEISFCYNLAILNGYINNIGFASLSEEPTDCFGKVITGDNMLEFLKLAKKNNLNVALDYGYFNKNDKHCVALVFLKSEKALYEETLDEMTRNLVYNTKIIPTKFMRDYNTKIQNGQITIDTGQSYKG